MPSRFDARVTEKKELAENIWLIGFETLQDLDFIPGQYVSLRVSVTGVRRSYSVYSFRKNKSGVYFELLVDVAPMGIGSKYVLSLKLGDMVNVLGFVGVFVFDDLVNGCEEIVFVATGTGIVPIRAIIEDLLEKKKNLGVKLIWGMKDVKSLYGESELREWKNKSEGFDYEIYLSRERVSGYGFGYVQDGLSKEKNIDHKVFYLCGLSDMVREVREMLMSLGVDEDRIIMERYT